MSGTTQDAAALTPLVGGLPGAAMHAWPVSPEVRRHSSSEGEPLLAPLV